MDFTFTENQTTVRDLARGILESEVTPDRLKRLESAGTWFDAPLWATLAEAGLLGLPVPVEEGGMGFGLLELAVLLEEIGRVLAPVPALPALVLGALPIAAFGTEAQRQDWLGPLAAGEVILSAALADAAAPDPAAPATTARRDGPTWRLDGRKELVPAADLAARILVPAATAEGVGVFLLDPGAAGVTRTSRTTTTGEPLATLELAGARVADADLLGGDAREGGDVARWMHERALVGLCATQVGVSDKALQTTAAYVRERVQFGVPIGSFQAVQHRMADGFIDLAAMRWTTWRAAWRLVAGLPALRETAVAKFWAAEAGARIAASAQHLHAGIGVDMDYPIHRYFLWSKSLELALGAAPAHLVRLGRDLAASGPTDLG
jgi:3-oxocholest-4-en-26-oyl-CoA dehydrogenase beta subunit